MLFMEFQDISKNIPSVDQNSSRILKMTRILTRIPTRIRISMNINYKSQSFMLNKL